MVRTHRFGGPGTAQPAGAATRVISCVAAPVSVLWPGVIIVIFPGSVLVFLLLAGPFLVLAGPAALCSVIAVVLLRRDGVASGSLLAVSAPFFILIAMIVTALAGWWSAPASAACVGVMFPLVGPLFWERRRKRNSAKRL